MHVSYIILKGIYLALEVLEVSHKLEAVFFTWFRICMSWSPLRVIMSWSWED